MATYFELPLWIDFDDIMNRADYFREDLEEMSSDTQDGILQWVHDQLYLTADEGVSITFKDGTSGGSPGSSQFSMNGWTQAEITVAIRNMQTNIGAWGASFTIDNPAGTGSLSGVSIDAFSVTNTMAKNNATADDLANANQYGTQAFWWWNQRVGTKIMI